ncbi:MAG TPA: DUF4350 domain-containing protein, partial [Bacteroidota bacterium]|nr:DUF4350 domain-containing protein [Bacteroidota bacterium]
MKRILPFVPLGVILLLFGTIEFLKPRPVDWTPSFSALDKIPYGTYVLREMIPDLFPGDSIRVSDQSLYTLLERNDSATGQNLLIMNDAFGPDELELRSLLEYVGNGNSVFIAAGSLSHQIADSLGFKTSVNFSRIDTAS